MKLTTRMQEKINALSTEQRLAWNLIPEGYQNAVSRPYLVEKTGLSDRRVRAIIAQLVSYGLPVGSSTKGYQGGYFKINSVSDLDKARHMKGRALKLLKRDKALEQVGVELFGTRPTLFDEVKEVVS